MSSVQYKNAQTLMPGSIAVACNELGMVDCKRCQRVLTLDQVAFLTRVAPDDVFEAWCPACSTQLSRWALIGAAELTKEDADGEFEDDDS